MTSQMNIVARDKAAVASEKRISAGPCWILYVGDYLKCVASSASGKRGWGGRGYMK